MEFSSFFFYLTGHSVEKMRNHLHMAIALLLLIKAVYITQVTFKQTLYKKTEPGQNITGKIGAELTVESKIECSVK